ncbi:hypothetical protein [Campylobacter concisus]|uniref:hypothetical protein n=1 Tax=Campylobacter concisus TaxID=199 RepID=UPI00215610D8|nr:hypothetical protein [Campylobacter concisus]
MKKSRLGLLQTHILDILTQDELEKFEFKELPKTSTIYAEDIEIIVLKSGSAKLSFFEDGEEFILYHLEKTTSPYLMTTAPLKCLKMPKFTSLD